MNILSKSTLISEYQSGKSMFEISQILKCSVHKISYWMNKYHISKRTRSDAMYTKLNPHGDPFRILISSAPNNQFLLGLGLGIYWGEGNKSDKNQVRVTNSDPKVILAFKRFLQQICQVELTKIKYSLICFNDTTSSVAATHWSQILNITPEKFGKIVQIPPQGKGTYKRKSKYGVCSISVNNIKLKSWIMEQMESLDARIV